MKRHLTYYNAPKLPRKLRRRICLLTWEYAKAHDSHLEISRNYDVFDASYDRTRDILNHLRKNVNIRVAIKYALTVLSDYCRCDFEFSRSAGAADAAYVWLNNEIGIFEVNE